jgi:EAL domain-containing protein (putative c-di-GMP-specific phosphodiesterase class I)
MLNALRQLFLREAPEVGAAEPVTLESLLDRGWLELFYQPKIDLRTRRLVGAEGLIRARHPARGILPPAAFLPGANEQSLLAMTEYVIRTALRDWEAFAARGTPLKLSVNTPVSALLTLPLTTMLREERPRTANWPGLILEVTEDEIIHDLKLANEVADNLRSLNCTLALDDFGAGYSSLARLRQLPFSELKIDRSYAANCHVDRFNAGVCETIVELAGRFGLRTVARASKATMKRTNCKAWVASWVRVICLRSRCPNSNCSVLCTAPAPETAHRSALAPGVRWREARTGVITYCAAAQQRLFISLPQL